MVEITPSVLEYKRMCWNVFSHLEYFFLWLSGWFACAWVTVGPWGAMAVCDLRRCHRGSLACWGMMWVGSRVLFCVEIGQSKQVIGRRGTIVWLAYFWLILLITVILTSYIIFPSWQPFYSGQSGWEFLYYACCLITAYMVWAYYSQGQFDLEWFEETDV